VPRGKLLEHEIAPPPGGALFGGYSFIPFGAVLFPFEKGGALFSHYLPTSLRGNTLLGEQYLGVRLSISKKN